MRPLWTWIGALAVAGVAVAAALSILRANHPARPDPPSSSRAPTGPIVTYPVPGGEARGSGFTVKVRAAGRPWVPVDTYRTEVDYYSPVPASMAEFDARGAVQIQVRTPAEQLRSARVRPIGLGITPALGADGRTATFTLPHPADVVFEADGDTHESLHLFVNALARPQPKRRTEHVIFFGAGVHVIGGDHVLRIGSNTSVEIAGGAVLAGALDVTGSHVSIRGHGVIDPSRFFQPRDSPPTVRIRGASDIGIRDITILESQSEGFEVRNSRDVVLSHVREINSAYQSDGIDVMASTHVLIEGAFLRTSDDSIAVYASTPWGARGNSSDIAVRDCTLFPDVAHPVLVGTHGDPGDHNTIRHLLFDDLTILEEDVPKPLYQGALAVDAGDNNTVSEVQFEDIRVEHITEGQLVNVRVFLNPDYNTEPGALVRDVLFRNVTFPDGSYQASQIDGYDPSRRVMDVVFENVTRAGRLIRNPASGNIQVGPYTDSILFRAATRATSLDAASPSVRYSGPWKATGTVRITASARSSARFTFTGTEARLFGLVSPSSGIAVVQVDHAAPVTIDTYAASVAGQRLWFDTGVLSRGRHTLWLYGGGRHDVLSQGSGVALDRIGLVR